MSLLNKITMWMLIVSLSIVVQSALLTPVADDLIISLPDGQVQGTTYITDKNKTFYGFQGIPFAIPPLGNLRFEAPLPAQPWTGIWDATKDSKACFVSTSLDEVIHDEDCLYISVFTPSLKPAEKLAVMYNIYGGGFTSGTAFKEDLGPDFLVEEDVIFVAANYRVGPFGFLSTGDSAIVGNAGLKDQALAIKWTYDNIELFGGDSSKITIFGDSAGGASTGLQLVSKKAAGLYRAAIVESGSALTNWSIDSNPKAFADLVATQLGGETYLNNTQQLKEFLQGVPAYEINYVAYLLLLDQVNAFPVIEVENDDAFLTESPYELLDSGRFNQVPIVIGICANEAGIFIQDLETAQALALRYDTSPESIIPPDLRQNSSDNDVIIRTIQSLYLNDGETFSDNLVAVTNLKSDSMFTTGVTRHAEVASKYVPAYLYQFSYGGRTIYPYVVPGAEKTTHGAEILFLFNLLGSNTTDPTDFLTQNRLLKLWTNFAKFLNPTPEQTELIDVIWPTVAENELRFLNINATLEVQPSIRGARYEGWKYIYETYGKKPFITY